MSITAVILIYVTFNRLLSFYGSRKCLFLYFLEPQHFSFLLSQFKIFILTVCCYLLITSNKAYMLLKPFFTEFHFTLALRQVLYFSLAMGIYTLIPVSFHYFRFFSHIEQMSAGLETLLGIVLSLLLVFRTNRAYERWWEARSQWGILINISRTLAIKIKTIAQPDADNCKLFYSYISQFAVALTNHLRNTPYPDADALVSKLPIKISNIPVYICELMYAKINTLKEQKVINDTEFLIMDTELSKFMHVSGACEKIKTTYISLSFRAFVHHIMVLLFLFLPWKFADTFGVWTIPLMILLAYISFGLEGIARHLEEPFGNSIDDIQMENICNTIQASVGQVLIS